MNRLLITAGVMLALLGANWWQYQQVQAQSERAAKAEQSASDRLSKIQQLELVTLQRVSAEQTLAAEQRDLQATLHRREQLIKELERENQLYRDWAATRLPDDTQRLRKRPAFTSARDYQQWLLSQPDTLPAARDSPNPQQ